MSTSIEQIRVTSYTIRAKEGLPAQTWTFECFRNGRQSVSVDVVLDGVYQGTMSVDEACGYVRGRARRSKAAMVRKLVAFVSTMFPIRQ